MKWNINDFAKETGGIIVSQKSDGFDRICTDTRREVLDSAFFALKGNKDGHDFLESAFQKGALALVIEHSEYVKNLKGKITIVQVPCVRQALRQWAVFWRKKLGLKTAVITGSNGKTTAKHFCQIFFQDDPSVICSPESYNNELGVSLSILRAGLQTKILIQEMGANHPGEIEQLCRLAEPDVAVCTLVSPAHLKGFGSIEKISLEKEQIYLAHPAEFAIFNLDNPYTKAMKSRYKGHLPALTFSSQNKTADIFLQPAQEKENSFTVRGHIQGKKNSCRIPLAGVHNLTSVMTAVGVSLALGKNPEELWQKLPQLKTPDQRCQFIDGGDNVQIFFDAYNSNPQSMSAFIDHIALLNKKTPCVVCLGDMLELGDQSSFFHKELGEKTARLPIAYLFYIGRYRHDFEQGLKQAQFKGRYELFEQYDSKCRKRMASVLKPFSCFALKASRGLYFERIINDLKST